MLERTQRTAQS